MTKQTDTTAPFADAEPPASPIQITRKIAQNVLATIDAGLVHGVGDPEPGQMCVQAAVCYALGLPHGHDPGCVAPSLRRFAIRLNDLNWTSRRARAKGLRRLGLVQLGSRDALDEVVFAALIVRLANSKHVPAALRAVASIQEDEKDRAALNAAAKRCERKPNRASCLHARSTANAIHGSAAIESVACAATAAAGAALPSSTVSDRVQVIATCVDAVANARACGDQDTVAARDRSLAEFAEDVVHILIDMKAPGCEWLDLTTAIEQGWVSSSALRHSAEEGSP